MWVCPAQRPCNKACRTDSAIVNDLSAIRELPHDRQRGRLRVLVFSSVFPRRAQPVHGTFVYERVRHLAKLAEIRVLVPVAWYRPLQPELPKSCAAPDFSVMYARFWYPPKVLAAVRGWLMALSMLPQVVRLRRDFDFDLIDAHFAYPDGYAAILLGRWFHRPVSITMRGTEILQSHSKSGRRLCDWAITRAQQIIAVADTLAMRAREACVPPERITTIPNGIDSTRFHPLARSEARSQLGLPLRGRMLVSVGHVSPRKGFQHVIHALPRMIESAPDLRYVIIGGRGAETDNSADLRALVHALGLTDRVQFAGPQPADRVALWIGAADVVVHASEFEGCPNIILEAMACGRPVVATKVGDVERMVPPHAGILLDDPASDVQLAAAVLAALDRPWDPEKISAAGAARSWHAVAREVAVRWHLAVDPPQAGRFAHSKNLGTI